MWSCLNAPRWQKTGLKSLQSVCLTYNLLISCYCWQSIFSFAFCVKSCCSCSYWAFMDLCIEQGPTHPFNLTSCLFAVPPSEHRCVESAKIRSKYPDRVPVSSGGGGIVGVWGEQNGVMENQKIKSRVVAGEWRRKQEHSLLFTQTDWSVNKTISMFV